VIIQEVEASVFHKPLAEPFYPSWVPGYASFNSSAVICRLRTDEGIVGIAGGNAFADEAKGAVNLLRAYLLGLDAYDTDQLHSRLSAANRVLGIRGWFVEAAFWDIRGKAENKSVAGLLGATTTKIKAYASTGQLRSPEEAAAHAKQVVEMGFKGIKIRTRHDDIATDIAMTEAVRSAIGDEVALMCDANQAWRVDVFAKGPVWDLERAVETARQMESLNVTWLEEPLDMYDLDGYRRLREQTNTPIAAGELHGDPELVRLLIEAGGVDIVQPDSVFTGGITGAHQLAELAKSEGLGFSPHTWSNGLGLAANLHLAIAAPNCEWLEFPFDPPGWEPSGRDSMLSQPIQIDDEGFVHLTDLPGLGVELDDEALASHALAI